MSDHDSDRPRPAATEERPWLSLVEAAAATGWHPERLRSLARRGTIQSQRGNKGLLVQLPDDLVATDRSTEIAAGREADSHPETAGRDQADRLADRALIDTLREEVSELRVALARAEERAANAEKRAEVEIAAERRVAQAEVAAKDALITELRRPWWRRLIG
jgi:hypothetical protein